MLNSSWISHVRNPANFFFEKFGHEFHFQYKLSWQEGKLQILTKLAGFPTWEIQLLLKAWITILK